MQLENRPLATSGALIFILLISLFNPSHWADEETPDELTGPTPIMEATSPGHTVFGEYVGAHWCGPCMSSASPSLDNLKTSNPEDFTYISFFESASGGWPSDGPINRMSHVTASSSGYPTFSFADRQSGPCYKVGAGGTNFYDPEYSAGGCMDSSSNDFQLKLTMSLDSTTNDVTITLESKYVGAQSSVNVYVYAAVTEKIGADSYDNGVKPHHNWRSWLLDSTNSGFQQLTLDRNVAVEHTWVKSVNLVRSSSGYSQWENFWPVFALMDGPHTTYNQIYAAIDPDMGPLVDLGVSNFEAEINGGHPGLIPGDSVSLSATVENNGAEDHPDGAELVISYMDGLDHIEIERHDLPSMYPGQTITYQSTFDSSVLSSVASGAASLRAALEGSDSDRVDFNDMNEIFVPYDMPPIATRPTTVDGSEIYRGASLDFELSAIANDEVDDITTMTAELEYSRSGQNDWSSDWTDWVGQMGAGGNLKLIHSLLTPLDAPTGDYDTRVKWTDARGQSSEWLTTDSAFVLRNAIPQVISPMDPIHAGIPAVKVETQETISLEGLVWDAETSIEHLEIDSNAPQFRSWNPDDGTITVEFDRIIYDSTGSPIPQGLFITISDGEDSNTGTLLFNVIENGAPRWSSISPQSFDEGESASLILTPFLSDTNDEGAPSNPSLLNLNLESVEPQEFFDAIIVGHTLSVSAVDEDFVGIATVTVSASDGDQTTETTVTFVINNINDAPRIDTDGIEHMVSKVGSTTTISVPAHVSDVDHEFSELWIDVDTYDAGSATYDFDTGLITMKWDEPGTELVTITAIDPIGDSTTHIIEIEVVDSLPLLWDSIGAQGDISASFDTMDYSTNPVTTVTELTNHGLTDVEIRWQVCNSLTGVCTDMGTAFGFSPFTVQANEGVGLRVGDYIGLSVKAVDSSGFDRKSEMLKTYAVEPSEDIQEPTGEEKSSNESPSSLLPMAAGIVGILIVIGLTAAITIGRRSEPQASASVPVDAPLPLPPEGLPEGWTMEQWQYYGLEYLRGER